MLKHYIALLSILIFSNHAVANETYLSFGLGQAKYEETGINTSNAAYSAEADITAGAVTIGRRFNTNFAVEAMLITGLQNGALKLNGSDTGVDGKLDNSIAAYLVASTGFSDDVSAYAKAGVSKVEGSMSGVVNGVTYSVGMDDTDFSYGAGLQFETSETSRVKAEYLSLWSDKGTQWNGTGSWDGEFAVFLISYEFDI